MVLSVALFASEEDELRAVNRPAKQSRISQFCGILDIVKQKHLRLVIIGSITVDCRNSDMDPMSEAFLHFNQLELSMIRARVRSGMANARAKGRQIGRKPVTKKDLPTTFIKYYPSYADNSMTLTELARICGISRPTAYKYVNIMETYG